MAPPLAFACTAVSFLPIRNLRNLRPRATCSMSLIPPADANTRGLGVVITGSTKGVGRALAETFLSHNDTVIISSRDENNLMQAILSIRDRLPDARVFGLVADVSNYEDVRRLATFAHETLGTVSAFICNAGTVGQRAPLASLPPEQLDAVVGTNLLGSLYCAKEAMRIAQKQTKPLHLFLVDGSGTIGNATENYAAYGATKRSMPQLVKTLNAESKGTNMRFHTMSPGMVLTDLLLSGNTTPNVKKIFNFLAEEPETVSAKLVPAIRDIVRNDRRNQYPRFLTIPKAMYQMATGFLLGFRKNKFFDPTTGDRIAQSLQDEFNDNGVRLR